MPSPALAVLLGAAAMLACRHGRDNAGTGENLRVAVGGPARRLYPVRTDTGQAALHFPRSPRWRGDGSLVVSDDRSALLVVGGDGALRRVIGRRGSGPGEFRELWAFTVLAGDSMLTFDPSLRRMSLFAPDGGYVSSHSAKIDAGVGPAWFPDGATVAIDGAFNNRAYLGPTQRRGDVHDTAWVLYAARGDTVQRPLWRTPGEHAFAGEGVTFPVVFAGEPLLATLGDLIVVGHGESDTVQIRDRTGTLVAHFSSGLPRQPVPTTALREYFDSIATYGRRVTDDERHRAVVADSAPRFDRIVTDDRYCLWLRQWSTPLSTYSVWRVVDYTGQHQGDVRLPHGFKLSVIARSQALGILVDADGVPSVVTIPIPNGGWRCEAYRLAR